MIWINITDSHNLRKPCSHQVLVVVAHVCSDALIVAAFHNLDIIFLIGSRRCSADQSDSPRSLTAADRAEYGDLHLLPANHLLNQSLDEDPFRPAFNK